MDFIPVGPDDHVLGAEGAGVTLLEYGDFECPYCGEAFPIVKEVLRIVGGAARFVFRHFPVTSAHPHAQRAAETAEWAARSGLFWPMHDLLYGHQSALGDAHLLEYGRSLGLDPTALRRAWAEHTYVPRIKVDFLGALRLGVTGTPAFFVDGVRYRGPTRTEDLVAAVRRG